MVINSSGNLTMDSPTLVAAGKEVEEGTSKVDHGRAILIGAAQQYLLSSATA